MQLAQTKVIPIVGLNWKDKDREAVSLLARTGSPYVAVPEDLDGRVGIDYGVTGTPRPTHRPGGHRAAEAHRPDQP